MFTERQKAEGGRQNVKVLLAPLLGGVGVG